MKTKCSAFWVHTNVRNDNNIFPCCRYKTPVAKFDGDVINILHKQEYQKLRQDSLGGVYNPNCQKCYYEESLGKKSLRQEFNEEYSTEEISLKFLEVGLDNICNLTCDGCWGEFSSSWAKKNDELIVVRSSKEITELPNTLTKIVFLGGEPLMTKRHIKLLKIANRRELMVTYNTNGTFMLDNETIDLLKQCRSVHFIVSVDGYGELNDKVRSGSNWSDVLKFIDQIIHLRFSITIHTVIHKNNWHGLPALENFIRSRRLMWTTNILTYPKKLDVANISNPEEFIDMVSNLNIPNKEYLINHVKTKHLLNYKNFSHSYKIDKVQEIANRVLRDFDWRKLRDRLSHEEKDPEGTYMWWYSRSSKNNQIFHDSNSKSLVEDTEYPEGSGHFNIELNLTDVPEFENFKNVLDLPGLTYAGIFFMGPNTDIVDHTDKEQYNMIINVQVPNEAFLKIDNETYCFTDNQIVMFDGDIAHSAVNNSNRDWVALVLRINKSEFNL
jgi:MoaA/NifB/PqqE/SkfB family radical SAM enzyme